MSNPRTALVRPQKKPVDIDKAFEVLSAYEGFRAKPYKDSKGKWTIGIGHLIGDGSDAAYKKSPFYNKTISKEAATKLAKAELSDRLPKVVSLIGDQIFDMKPNTQYQLIASFYRGGITGSPKTLKLIREGKFKEAGDEFLDNDEYRAAVKSGSGVAGRMNNLAVALKSEEKPKDSSFEEAVEQRMSQ